jgi:hypothetical protein
MSAWAVSDAEIDCLAYWISTLGISKRTPTDIGRELRGENYKSLRARYGWYRPEYQKAPSYHYTEPRSTAKNGVTYDPYDLDQALKMVHFYDYQSCEHAGAWEKSQSYRWMQKLEHHFTLRHADWQREGLTWGAA